MLEIKKEAQKVLDTYGANTIAGIFAQKIIDDAFYSKIFDDFSIPLVVDETPTFTHTLTEQEIPKYNFQNCSINVWNKKND